MSRFLSLVIILIIVLMCVLVIYYSKDAYQLLTPNKIAEESIEPENLSEGHENWLEFQAPSRKFKVLLPSLPQHVTDTAKDPTNTERRTYDTYVSSAVNGTSFMINVITFPQEKDTSNTVGLLNQVVNDIVAHKEDNKLKNMKMESFKNNTAVRFEIINDDVLVNGLAFIQDMQDKELIVLTMIAKEANYDQREFAFFTNSFELETQHKTK